MFGKVRRRKWVRVRDFNPNNPLQQSGQKGARPTDQNGVPSILARANALPSKTVSEGRQHLEVTSHSQVSLLFSTKNATSAREHVSVWQPVQVPCGWAALGHVAIPNSTGHPPKTFLVRMNPHFVASPASYVCVWCSEGQGATRSGESAYFWWPIAPYGFVAMGAIVTNVLSPPSLDAMKCVRRDCVKILPGLEHITRIWKESGMNMSTLCSLWQRQGRTAVGDLFICQEDHNRPNQVVYELDRYDIVES
jgi:hypothetical protein